MSNKRRQEIYDRIRQTSKAEFILDEMVRLGFWPQQGALPVDPADEIRRQAQLRKELSQLTTKLRRLKDVNKLREDMRKKRMADSRKRRKETKLKRIHNRKVKAFKHQQKLRLQIDYLGAEVSAGLNDRSSDEAKLRGQNLPVFHSAADIAKAADIAVPHLRHLTFHRRVSRTSHYVRFLLPKKTGGERLISAPMPKLKWLQTWILQNVLQCLNTEEPAHGFVKDRSIVSNAKQHLYAEVVVNVDLKDFFPTLTYRRVKGFFRKLGYSDNAATVLALATTEPVVEEVELDGVRYFVQTGERFLPQGAPTSPALTNLICRRLDRRMTGLAKSFGLTYTRYADDFSFSGDSTNLGRFFGAMHRIVKDEGFKVHPEKTRVFRKGSRQEVTGLVVNSGRPTVPRKTLRKFRALLFQIEKDGPEGKAWTPGTNVMHSIRGFANFVSMVTPDKGKKLAEQVDRIVAKHGAGPAAPTHPPARPKSDWFPDLPDLGAEPILDLNSK